MLAEVGHFIDMIYGLGARRIAVFGLGPVGCVPARVLLGAPVTRCYGKMNKAVKNYNTGLENMVKGLPVKYPGALGVYGAVYKTIQIFRADPKLYGNFISPFSCSILRFNLPGDKFVITKILVFYDSNVLFYVIIFRISSLVTFCCCQRVELVT